MVFSVEGCDGGRRVASRGEPFMRAHHTQKLDHYTATTTSGDPFSAVVVVVVVEKDSISGSQCVQECFYISSDSPTLYLARFTRLRWAHTHAHTSTRIHPHICVHTYGGRNISFFTPPEQYRRRRRARSTRMKNVVNIVQFVRGFLRFIIFSIYGLSSFPRTIPCWGWIPAILDFIPETLWKITLSIAKTSARLYTRETHENHAFAHRAYVLHTYYTCRVLCCTRCKRRGV